MYIRTHKGLGQVPAPSPALRRFNESEVQMIQDGLRRGYRDVNYLTGLVFQARHTELRGQLLRRDKQQLVQEWLDIRNRLVRPVLARYAARQKVEMERGGYEAVLGESRTKRKIKVIPICPPAEADFRELQKLLNNFYKCVFGIGPWCLISRPRTDELRKIVKRMIASLSEQGHRYNWCCKPRLQSLEVEVLSLLNKRKWPRDMGRWYAALYGAILEAKENAEKDHTHC